MNTTSLSGGNGTSEIVDRAHLMVDKAVDQLAPVVQGASTAAHQTIDKVHPPRHPWPNGHRNGRSWQEIQRTRRSLQRAGPRTANATLCHCDR